MSHVQAQRSIAMLLVASAALAMSAPAAAEVIAASPTHFELRQAGHSDLPPAALWERLVHPSRWWNPAHTYSGDAGNLTLEASLGGLWREDWDGGAVAHGRVLLRQPPRLLRLEAPFGPLQGLGVYSVWSIAIEAEGDGSRVSFHETAIGPPGAGLDALATAVDTVKSEALQRLTRPPAE